MIAVSIVSHGHGVMVMHLIQSLLKCSEVAQIIVTRNIPESLLVPMSDKVLILDNPIPKGFGENHNAAFGYCSQPFFCPLNPDISLIGNPFERLLNELEKSGAAIAAPLVLAPDGGVEDSARPFPTIISLLWKAFKCHNDCYNLQLNDPVFFPDWIAGMFMLFRSKDYDNLGGFDPKFFLYYEDVDICVRARIRGMRLIVCPSVAVTHDARRDSHRKFAYLCWHLASMARYFVKYWGRLPLVKN